MRQETPRHASIPVVALFLAWFVPGAGHVYLGRWVRGLILFVTISATFWAGVAMGGVMTADPHRERWWFIAEMFAGAHGVAAWQVQRGVVNRLVSKYPPRRDVDVQTYVDKILADEKIALVSPTASVARAYAGVAGLLNLMCMFDAFMLSLLGSHGEPKRKKNPIPS